MAKMENNILFRCSGLGNLMTGITELTTAQLEKLNMYRDRQITSKPITDLQMIEFGKLIEKQKSTDIGETAKSFVLDTFLNRELGYDEVVVSDAMMKGLLLESEAISLVSEFENKLYIKNKIRKKNDWIIGELDVNANDHIKDIKVSKSIGTFSKTSSILKSYYWQAVGYMWLWDIQKYSLTYVLMPDTDEMIERQLSRLSFNLVGKDYEVAEVQIRHNNEVIKKLPLQQRIKTFDFELKLDDIESLKIQINKARIEYNRLLVEGF